MFSFMYVRMYSMYWWMEACVYACMKACVHVCMNVCMGTFIRACIHACIHCIGAFLDACVMTSALAFQGTCSCGSDLEGSAGLAIKLHEILQLRLARFHSRLGTWSAAKDGKRIMTPWPNPLLGWNPIYLVLLVSCEVLFQACFLSGNSTDTLPPVIKMHPAKCDLKTWNDLERHRNLTTSTAFHVDSHIVATGILLHVVLHTAVRQGACPNVWHTER